MIADRFAEVLRTSLNNGRGGSCGFCWCRRCRACNADFHPGRGSTLGREAWWRRRGNGDGRSKWGLGRCSGGRSLHWRGMNSDADRFCRHRRRRGKTVRGAWSGGRRGPWRSEPELLSDARRCRGGVVCAANRANELNWECRTLLGHFEQHFLSARALQFEAHCYFLGLSNFTASGASSGKGALDEMVSTSP